MSSILHSFNTHLLLLLLLILEQYPVRAGVTVYTAYGAAASAVPSNLPCIGAAPCDQFVNSLVTNPDPGAGLSQSVPVQLYSGGMAGAGAPVSGDFQGFSIELSVANQIMGNRGNDTNIIFMNLMSSITSRSGRILLRVGGNSQETATLVPGGLPKDDAIFKTNKTAFTPTLDLSPNLIEVMGNISKFIDIGWFIGIPFNDTVNPRPILAELSQELLGKNLIGMQLGNEPDLYYRNGVRPPSYGPQDYFNDWGKVLADYQNDTKLPHKNMFVAPSVCCGQDVGWTPELVWSTGFLDAYASSLSYIAVQHYPISVCSSVSHDLNFLTSSLYANHSAVFDLVSPYINSAAIAAQYKKPFIMFETNTASCGGFPGLSDSFQSALWTVDYVMNMAANNITNALFHVGGKSDNYNAFTPPPTNQTKYRQWSVSPSFYSALVSSEAFGTSGKAQVLDLGLNGGNDFSPGYVVYEDGDPMRLVLINYLSDQGTGAANYTAFISVGGNGTGQPNATPSQVSVKYLLAPVATDKWNVTWAGQTFGGPFASDGRLRGEELIYTFACDATNNVCPITVPAPGVALVFLSPTALMESQATATVTYATSYTSGIYHPTLNPSIVATSNGRGGQNFLGKGSTSVDSASGASGIRASIAFMFIAMMSAVLLLNARR